MDRFKGKSAYPAIAIGKFIKWENSVQQVKRYHVDDIVGEKKRFEVAVEKAKEQLKELYNKAALEVGIENAMIFEIHQMMLDDGDYCDSVSSIIDNQLVNAEFAVSVTADQFSRMFAQMDDAYMKERAIDVKDVSERVINVLLDKKPDEDLLLQSGIVLAEDITPSETIQMDKKKVLAFVTKQGSLHSHTAILARTMGIPALVSVNIDLNRDYTNQVGIVDGMAGYLYLEPDDETLSKMKDKIEEEEKKKELLNDLKGKKSVTKSGHPINVYANIGGIEDLGMVNANDAEGIGLLRSEFLYLESENYPSEDTLFQAYKRTVETMGSKKVIIRTLDIGADKQVDYFNLDKEENPAMGYRAIRICLDRLRLLQTQLRALLRASAYGNLSVMIPMIISVKEVLEVKKRMTQVENELSNEGIPYKNVELGIMIETPAAVMISEELAKEVDFFSIGTNDLTQYTLAIDRQNQKLEKWFDPHHPAVLKMIKMTIENAHKNGIWVGICGELGADFALTETFAEWKVDEISVSPTMILSLRDKIRQCK